MHLVQSRHELCESKFGRNEDSVPLFLLWSVRACHSIILRLACRASDSKASRDPGLALPLLPATTRWPRARRSEIGVVGGSGMPLSKLC